MHWIAHSERDATNGTPKKVLWDTSDQFRTPGLKAQEGPILGNSYYDNPHGATGRFDFVLANRSFNGNAVDTAMRLNARRHSEGTPQDLPERQDNARLKKSVRPGPQSETSGLAAAGLIACGKKNIVI